MIPPSPRELDRAAERLRGRAHRTPILRSTTVDRRVGARVLFKCECFQKVGAFKYRGAHNALADLSPEARARGVVTHSSGNHGQALARAAAELGVAATVVMPENAPAAKRSAVQGYGAEVKLSPPSMEGREEVCQRVIERTGATLVHSYDNPSVIAGQSTVARELIEDAGVELDLVLAPVGGGGLISGTSLVTHQLSPSTRIVACEPAGADDAYRSFRSGELEPLGRPETLADGLRMRLSPLTFGILKQHVHEVVTVDDGAIVDAMRFVWERMKIVIEPSAAVAPAVLFSGRLDLEDLDVGVILTGGNLDLDRLPWTPADSPPRT
ncbi:MAG: threonine/serine dehydratase [Holophagales bacterium]|nr:threonine/serine dehydratase [Holophagales bacterium]